MDNTKTAENGNQTAPPPSELDEIVAEVIAESHIGRDLILPEEIEFIRAHVLKKPLRVIHIWALGVGVVITGEYFGWNFGLLVGGPLGVLIASLLVCVLYLGWVLSLSELSVAMPFAGGPLAYGRRAVGRWFGFTMAWSMFLECLFATIGTAMATGGYVAFLLNPDKPDPVTTTLCAVACALLFFVIQYVGVKEQAVIMLWLTYAAIVALVWFWIAALPGVRLERILTQPLLHDGWSGVLGAVPYALWWLVIIETVALASEEAQEPQVSIPRGLILAQITLVVLVVLTWFFAAGAAPVKETGSVVYPLPLVLKNVWGTGRFLTAFSAMALAGMLVSYNGMIYATSRQSFSLGRAGYLPEFLGKVHSIRRTPHVSLIVCTGVTIGFILLGHFYANATAVAILISTLTAVIWYVLAVFCLILLRRKEPELSRPYKVPVYPWIPVFVAILSGFSAIVYSWANVQVLLPTALLYAVALIWYGGWARKKVLPIAPEEVAARIAEELAKQQVKTVGSSAAPALRLRRGAIMERAVQALLMLGTLSLAWMSLRAMNLLPVLGNERLEVTMILVIWTALFVVIGLVGYRSTRRQP